MLKSLSILALSIFANSAFAAQEYITPLCSDNDNLRISYLHHERKLADMTFIPIMFINGNTTYGLDGALVTETEVELWSSQCNENEKLLIFLDQKGRYVPIKTEIKTNIDFSIHDNFYNSSEFDYQTFGITPSQFYEYKLFKNLISFVSNLSKRTLEFPEIAQYLRDNSLKIDFVTGSAPFDHDTSDQDTPDGQIKIDIDLLSDLYLTVHNTIESFSHYRLFTRQLVQAASNQSLTESEIIEKTNKILTAMGLPDLPRTVRSSMFRKKRAIARPQPTPEERLRMFFERPVEEFVSDPMVYATAALIAPQLSSVAISRLPMHAPVVRPPLHTTTAITRATGESAITTAVDTAQPIITVTESVVEEEPVPIRVDQSRLSVPETSSRADSSSLSSRNPTASANVRTHHEHELFRLSDLSSIDSDGGSMISGETTQETLLSTVHETTLSSDSSNASMRAGLLTDHERILFTSKVDRDLQTLDLPVDKKIEIQSKMSSTAHFLTQAPELVRKYLRNNMTLLQLHANLPS